jgi:S-adenosylmethionine synthetase
VDTYGGKGAHGGGAFSGRILLKWICSAAYARTLQKNLVAAGLATEFRTGFYAIGVVEPTSIYVDTYGTLRWILTDGEIAKSTGLFDMRPAAIESRLKLRNPIYRDTAAYLLGHLNLKW